MTPWTETEIQQLTKLMAQGHEIPQMAKRLGRSQEAVRAKQAVLRGKRNNSGKMLGPTRAYPAPFQSPAYRPNDDAKHLRLIYEALQTEGRANAL